jgi:signal transduction histidine kinase
MNLLGNAIKHTNGAEPRVAVSWAEAGAFYEFTVADNGAGIAPQFHERIFGIFQTLEARDKVEGTGIGLSVVKKIVEAKGGRVWVESDVGQGARFKFLWPAEEIVSA